MGGLERELHHRVGSTLSLSLAKVRELLAANARGLWGRNSSPGRESRGKETNNEIQQTVTTALKEMRYKEQPHSYWLKCGLNPTGDIR